MSILCNSTDKMEKLIVLECLASTYTPRIHSMIIIMLQMTQYALNEKHNEYA